MESQTHLTFGKKEEKTSAYNLSPWKSHTNLTLGENEPSTMGGKKEKKKKNRNKNKIKETLKKRKK